VTLLPRLKGTPALAAFGLLALLGVNLAVFLVYTFPRLLKEKTLSSRERTLAEEVSREKALLESLKERERIADENAKDKERLYHTLLLPPGRGMVPLLEELNRLGNEAGLRWENESFKTTEVPGTPLLRMGITVPFSGLYKQMIDFLSGIEGSKRFLVVDQIQLHSRSDNAGDLAIELSAYFYGAGK
jgi:Tfp pilus assembly protein PilO